MVRSIVAYISCTDLILNENNAHERQKKASNTFLFGICETFLLEWTKSEFKMQVQTEKKVSQTCFFPVSALCILFYGINAAKQRTMEIYCSHIAHRTRTNWFSKTENKKQINNKQQIKSLIPLFY